MYKSIFRPLLFHLDAEDIHNKIVKYLQIYRHLTPYERLSAHHATPKQPDGNGETLLLETVSDYQPDLIKQPAALMSLVIWALVL